MCPQGRAGSSPALGTINAYINKMTLTEFFSKAYLFDPYTTRESRLYLPLLILFGFLIVFALLIKFVPKFKFKKLIDRYFTCFLTAGILGFIYLFCRYEELPWLGSRFFLLCILAGLFIWIVINTIWSIRYIPRHKRETKTEERYNKYLPKKKQASKK